MSEYICKDPRFNKLKVSCFLTSANLAKWFQNDNTTKQKNNVSTEQELKHCLYMKIYHPRRATLTASIQNRLSYDSRFSR